MRFRVLLAVSLLAVPALFIMAPQPVAASSVAEGFESFAVFAKPSSTAYTYTESGTGAIYVTDTQHDAGTKSLRMTNGMVTEFGLGRTVCGLSFAVATSQANAQLPAITLATNANQATTPAPYLIYTVSFSLVSGSTYQATLNVVGTNVASTTTSGLIFTSTGIAANTFYHFTIACPSTIPQSPATATMVLSSPEAAALGNTAAQQKTFSGGGGANAATVAFLMVDCSGCGNTAYIDSLAWTAVATPSAAWTTSLTSLTDFDVDPTGTTLLARTDGGANVKALSAQSGVVAATDATGCGAYSHGVAALDTHVSYVKCSSGSTVSGLAIRSNTLGTANIYPAGCDGDCQQDFDLSSDAQAVGMNEITNLELYKFDYSARQSPCALNACSYVPIVWAFSTADGKLGLFGDVDTNNAVNDHFDYDVVQYDPTQTTQMCRAYDTASGRDYLYAVSSNGVTRGYQTTVEVTPHGFSPDGASIDVSIQQPAIFSGSTTYNQAQAIGCNDNLIAVCNQYTQLVWLVDRGTGADLNPSHTGQAAYCLTASVSLSKAAPSGAGAKAGHRFLAYEDTSTTVKVVDVTNGTAAWTTVASITIPSGTFKRLEMDQYAQSLWIGTSTGVSRFDIHAATTINAISNTNTVTTATSSSSPTGLPGVDSTQFAVALGISQEAGGWLIGLFLIVGLAAGLYFVSPNLGYLGAALGLGMGLAFGLIPLWFILFLVLGGATFLVLKFKGASA